MGGSIGFATHYTLSLTFLGTIYLAVSSRRDELMSFMPAYVPQTGTDLVISMAIHKLTLPIRIPLTLVLVPAVYRTASKLGIVQVLDQVTSKLGLGSALVAVEEESGKKSELI